MDDELERRQAARERLIPFCQYLWPGDGRDSGFVTRPYRELLAGALELVESRTINRFMAFAPSQYGKSEITSRNFPAWYMGRNPDDAQILCSYNGDLAFNLSFEARQRVMSPFYAALFGPKSTYWEVPVEISEERAATKEWRLAHHRGRMKAAGMGAGIAGHPADLLIIDDPVKDYVDIQSPLIQDKHIAWFNGQVFGRLSKKGALVITMTRWHENDLCGYLLRKQADGGELYYILRLTALAESPERIRVWCDRNNVSVDRYIVADMVFKTGRGYS